MQIRGVLETCLYATDLAAAEHFYAQTLGLAVISRAPGRHVFFRCGQAVFLVFNPQRTRSEPGSVAGAAIPAHGTEGAGHAAFRVPREELPAWRQHLARAAVPIESEVSWPQGGQSIYFRDPAGNSVELASPEIWGLAPG